MVRKSHYFIYFECKDNIFCLKYEISQKKVVLLHRKFEKFYKFMKKLSLITVMLAVLTIVCFTSVGCTDKKPAPAVDSTAADTAVADTQAMDSTEKLIEETPMPKAADELFDDFLFNFAASRKLQMERIHFPLAVYRNDKLKKHIEKRHWKMEHFFMRQDYYTLIFDNHKQMKLMKDTTIDHVVIEKVFYSRKIVQQFLFNRINGQWMMTSINYKPMYQNMNASFLKFYGAFATDTAFQARHLHNPVKFTGPDPDDDFSTMTGEIEPETWPAFAPQLPHGMIYNIIYGQKYTESGQKIFVIRGIANGMETRLTFMRIEGRWQLMKLEM
jgi:putative lipoprotein